MAKELKVFISLENQQIQIEWSGLSQPIAAENMPFVVGFGDTSFFLSLLLDSAKPVFFNELPADRVDVQIDEAVDQIGYLKSAAQSLQNTLQRTNELLKTLQSKKNIAASFGKTLFYSADDHPDLKELQQSAESLEAGSSIYRSFSTGWNKDDRQWEKSKSFSIEELVEFIKKEKIKRVVTLNMYYLKHCLRDAVFALAVFRWLGLEYVMIDLDIYDLHWNFSKNVFNDDQVSRFSMFPQMAKAWDEVYRTPNIRYIPCALSIPHRDPPLQLQPDFEVVVASHARVPDLLKQLSMVLYVFEKLSDESIYDDFQIWYYSFRHWILGQNNLSLFEKEYANSTLYTLYLNGITFLKYETIERLKTQRRVRLYGDQGWALIFPDKFEGRYLENFDEVFSKGRALNLLMNVNFSYLEVNPVVHRALAKRIPFLNFQPLVRIRELDGMKGVEYKNVHEISEKIEKLNDVYKEPAFESACSYLRGTLNETRESLLNAISDRETGDGILNFESECERHNELSIKRTADFLSRNMSTIQEQFDCFFRGGELPPVQDLASKSRFRTRDYLKRLLDIDRAGNV